MAEEERPIAEKALHQPPQSPEQAGAPPLATNAPKPVEEMAQQVPPRSTTEANTEKAPSNRTSDKQTERDEGGTHFSTVPGAAKED